MADVTLDQEVIINLLAKIEALSDRIAHLESIEQSAGAIGSSYPTFLLTRRTTSLNAGANALRLVTLSTNSPAAQGLGGKKKNQKVMISLPHSKLSVDWPTLLNFCAKGNVDVQTRSIIILFLRISVFLYIAIAVLSMIILNPFLWQNPVNEIKSMSEFHLNYSKGEHVAESNFSWWQPIIWLISPMKEFPYIFPQFLDVLILFLALIGWPRELKSWVGVFPVQWSLRQNRNTYKL